MIGDHMQRRGMAMNSAKTRRNSGEKCCIGKGIAQNNNVRRRNGKAMTSIAKAWQGQAMQRNGNELLGNAREQHRNAMEWR